MFGNTLKLLDWAKAVYSVVLWAVFFLVSLATAQAATVTLEWAASTSATVTGYNVYYRAASGSYGPAQNAGNSTTYTTPDLANGTYYFVVKAYDGAGNESGPSNEVSSTTYTFTTQPSGLNLSYNGVSCVTPFTVRAKVGSSQQISALATQQYNSQSYNFSAWSDSGAATHTIMIGSLPQTYNATYVPATGTTPAPVAKFTVDKTKGPDPLIVTFTTDVSTANISSWSWDFGDGILVPGAAGQVFVKNYAYRSTPYTVSLKVTGPGGSNTKTQPITVDAVNPTADFTASPRPGGTPLAMTFTNTSSGTITAYTWSFGDGSNPLTTQTKTNPSYTYANPGTYPVTLTANGPTGTTPSMNRQNITVSAPSTGSGLVAAYSFQEASGLKVVDASGKGYHGTPSCNNATDPSCTRMRTSSGKFGKALLFDGVDDRVSLGTKLDFSLPFTAEAWIYPTSFANWRVILSKRDSFSSSDMRFDIGLANGTGALYVQDGTFNTSSYVPPLNTWTHIAVIIDAKKAITLYVNGAFKQSLGTLSPGSDSTAEVMIGNTGDLDDPFQGRIDEIRVYNRALTATDIANEWNKAVEVTSPPKPLLGDEASPSVTGSTQPGIPVAFRVTASVTGMVTSLPVYLDKSSASTKLVAGLYTDNGGNPGTLLASGTLTSPKAGALNRVLLPATAVQANTTYWVAILSPSGTLTYKAGSVARPSVTSTSSLTLPNPSWTTTISSASGGMPAYGAGY